MYVCVAVFRVVLRVAADQNNNLDTLVPLKTNQKCLGYQSLRIFQVIIYDTVLFRTSTLAGSMYVLILESTND